jgi:aminoglycoside/choline kinase family phosphotransferase
MGLSARSLDGLEAEFADLAEAVAAQPRVLLHRDFQSQNILLQGGAVRLVDYQGLRLGPLAYDLASLVWDPYVDIPAGLRQDLVTRFAAGCPRYTPAAVANMTLAAGLQRVMQALGAYGFLGRVKGKTGFLAHVPAAVHNLQDLLHELAVRRDAAALVSAGFLPPALPRLTRLVAGLGPAESDS